MENLTIENHICIVLTEMFKSVGAEYVPGIEKEGDWFLKHSWTQVKEDEFVKWLADYLFNNPDARKKLMSWHYKDKKRCLRAAKEFVNNYGWKTEN